MTDLLSSMKVCKTFTLKNRFVFPPMCTYQAQHDGIPSKFHEIHYGGIALGGTGLIIVEATAVETRGRISENDLGLWNNIQISGHQTIVNACHSFDAKVAVQLAHAGRKSGCQDTQSVAPSALSFSEKYQMPHALTLEEIETVKNSFVQAAIRAEKASYDAVELHAAHGYLLFSFLSPISNQRTDSYGGNFNNRIRFLVEVIQAIKKTVKIPVWIRLSATEWMSGGWTLEDSVKLCQIIQDDIVLVHVSAGGNVPNPDQLPEFKPLYQVPYAKAIKEAVSIPVIAVGLITTIDQGNAILNDQSCDLVAYGRELTRNPNLPYFASREMEQSQKIHSAYLRSFK